MENFSETKKGGRPRVVTGELRRVIDFAVGNPNATERTRQNKLYQLRAMNTLGLTTEKNTPRAYLWIWGKPHVPRQGDHKVKWTVLAELGRIEDAETMRRIAAQVCELKLSTAEAVRAIRRVRTGRVKSGDALELANAIIATINAYMNQHSGLTTDDILNALHTAKGQVIGGGE